MKQDRHPLHAVVIRADGSQRFGMGHVMRGIALAQAFQAQSCRVVFVIKDLPGTAPQKIRDFGFDLVLLDAVLDHAQDAAATEAAARAIGTNAVVVDLGHAETLSDEEGFIGFLAQLRGAGLAVTVVEGMDSECLSMRSALPAAAIVVPYFDAQTRRYHALPGVKVLAGARYFPFRADFLRAGGKLKPAEDVARRILVSIGGGDVAQHNRKVYQALCAIGADDLDVRMTGAAPAVSGQDGVPLQAIENSRDMAELIHWADLAVIGSGLTRYETAYLATPAVVLSLNPAHAAMVEAFAATGAVCHGGILDRISVDDIVNLLHGLRSDRPRRMHMAEQGLAVTDGQGAARVVAHVRELLVA